MCRMLGMVSARRRDACDFLIDSRYSLLAQSDWDRKRRQKDGWGVGSWTGKGWKVVHGTGAVFREKSAFGRACRNAVSEIVIGHIRQASNPRKLPHAQLLATVNTQPFQLGRYIFVHNGTVTIPDEVAATMGPWKKRIRGINDSEVLFWLLMRNFRKLGRMPAAFSKTVDDLWSVWEHLDKSVQQRAHKLFDRDEPYHGLNCFVSDGKNFWAFCRHDGASKSRALCGKGRPIFELCYATREGRTVVASERTDRLGDWKFMRDGTVLAVSAGSPGRVSVGDI